jgi:hypothetical protein
MQNYCTVIIVFCDNACKNGAKTVASKSMSDLQVIKVQHLYVQVSNFECILSQDTYYGF